MYAPCRASIDTSKRSSAVTRDCCWYPRHPIQKQTDASSTGSVTANRRQGEGSQLPFDFWASQISFPITVWTLGLAETIGSFSYACTCVLGLHLAAHRERDQLCMRLILPERARLVLRRSTPHRRRLREPSQIRPHTRCDKGMSGILRNTGHQHAMRQDKRMSDPGRVESG